MLAFTFLILMRNSPRKSSISSRLKPEMLRHLWTACVVLEVAVFATLFSSVHLFNYLDPVDTGQHFMEIGNNLGSPRGNNPGRGPPRIGANNRHQRVVIPFYEGSTRHTQISSYAFHRQVGDTSENVYELTLPDQDLFTSSPISGDIGDNSEIHYTVVATHQDIISPNALAGMSSDKIEHQHTNGYNNQDFYSSNPLTSVTVHNIPKPYRIGPSDKGISRQGHSEINHNLELNPTLRGDNNQQFPYTLNVADQDSINNNNVQQSLQVQHDDSNGIIHYSFPTTDKIDSNQNKQPLANGYLVYMPTGVVIPGNHIQPPTTSYDNSLVYNKDQNTAGLTVQNGTMGYVAYVPVGVINSNGIPLPVSSSGEVIPATPSPTKTPSPSSDTTSCNRSLSGFKTDSDVYVPGFEMATSIHENHGNEHAEGYNTLNPVTKLPHNRPSFQDKDDFISPFGEMIASQTLKPQDNTKPSKLPQNNLQDSSNHTKTPLHDKDSIVFPSENAHPVKENNPVHVKHFDHHSGKHPQSILTTYHNRRKPPKPVYKHNHHHVVTSHRHRNPHHVATKRPLKHYAHGSNSKHPHDTRRHQHTSVRPPTRKLVSSRPAKISSRPQIKHDPHRTKPQKHESKSPHTKKPLSNLKSSLTVKPPPSHVQNHVSIIPLTQKPVSTEKSVHAVSFPSYLQVLITPVTQAPFSSQQSIHSAALTPSSEVQNYNLVTNPQQQHPVMTHHTEEPFASQQSVHGVSLPGIQKGYSHLNLVQQQHSTLTSVSSKPLSKPQSAQTMKSSSHSEIQESKNRMSSSNQQHFNHQVGHAAKTSTHPSNRSLNDTYLNELVDFVIDVVNRGIKQKGQSQISIPDISKVFHKRVGYLQVKGKFLAQKGWFKDLSTLQRTTDVTVSRSGTTLAVECSIGLSTMKLGYDHYEAKFMHLGPHGKITGEVGSNSMLVNVSISIENGKKCKITLEEFKVTDVGSVKIDITGLGELEWLVSKISTWITEHYKNNIINNVESQIREEITSALSRVKCGPDAQH